VFERFVFFGLPPGYNSAMPTSQSDQQSASPSSSRFATTHWSVVVAAKGSTPQARQALAELCSAYWYPVYAYIRRQGSSVQDAQDLTQEYFARLLEKDFLRAVDPNRGKFRSFVLASCKHFLCNERDRATTLRRGGGRKHVSFDLQNAEERYLLEPAHSVTAEKLFERRWALTLLDHVLAQLRQEFEASGKESLFDQLKIFLMGAPDKVPHAQLADELNMTAGALKVAVHRLRRRYRELLRQEIARTVAEPAEVEDEIRALFTALGS
jgi:RNA polymerase sigma-70 factor (ECF subfamily)